MKFKTRVGGFMNWNDCLSAFPKGRGKTKSKLEESMFAPFRRHCKDIDETEFPEAGLIVVDVYGPWFLCSAGPPGLAHLLLSWCLTGAPGRNSLGEPLSVMWSLLKRKLQHD